MPQPLPLVIQAQIDIDSDRIAQGLISPPIVDFTCFNDQYHGQHPASMRKPDLRLIVSTLELVILNSLKEPADFLVYSLLGMHQLDQLDFEGCEIARGKSCQTNLRGEMGKNYNSFLI